MVQRLAAPEGPSARALAQEVGVSPATLSRWLKQAGTLSYRATHPTPSSRRDMTARRAQDWSAEEKLAVIIEAAQLSDEELGAFLRHRGLHEAQLTEWRQQMLEGLVAAPKKGRKGRSPEARRVRELERELNRKDKALAETAALLTLQKKARKIWGDEDDDTLESNGRRSCN